MEELRIYSLNLSATEKNTDELLAMPIERFADEAEENGLVYSLQGFIRDFNSNEGASLDSVIRVAIVQDGKIVKEVKP